MGKENRMKPDNLNPFYINAACLVNEYIYFTSYNSNWIFKLNIKTNNIEAVHLLLLKDSEMGMKFSGLYYYNDRIWMIPWTSENIYIYNIKNANVEQLPIQNEISEYSKLTQFRKSIVQGKYLWLLPCKYPGLIRVDMEEKSYDIYNEWPANVSFDESKGMNFKMMTLYNDYLYLFNDACNMSIKMSTKTGEMTPWTAGSNYSYGAVCNNKFYTAPVREFDPIKIISLEDNHISKTINLPDTLWMKQQKYLYCYWYTKTFEDKIFFMPHEANGIIMLDLLTEEINIVNIDISDYKTARVKNNYGVYDVLQYEDDYIIIPFQGNKIVIITGNGIIKEEIILETESRYLNRSAYESSQYNLENFIHELKYTDIKRINWKNHLSNQIKKDIGYKINKAILGELDNV